MFEVLISSQGTFETAQPLPEQVGRQRTVSRGTCSYVRGSAASAVALVGPGCRVGIGSWREGGREGGEGGEGGRRWREGGREGREGGKEGGREEGEEGGREGEERKEGGGRLRGRERVYSETSDKGHSERGQTSQQRTSRKYSCIHTL